jgi:hypothetical protein
MRAVFQVLTEGAAHAAAVVPLLFVLPTGAAQAQLPRVAAGAAAAPTLLEPTRLSGPLALKSRHMDIRIVDRTVDVRTTLVFSNDSAAPASASYLLTGGARLINAQAEGGCGDESRAEAEFAEVGKARPLDAVEVSVQPGGEIVIEMRRPGDLFVRGHRHRLVLPVVGDERSVFTPEFSATVEVISTKPIATLASATHGGIVSGIGEPSARIEIANGRAYTSPFIAVEFEVGEPVPEFIAANDEPMFLVNARARR